MAIGARIYVAGDECTSDGRQARLSALDTSGIEVWAQTFDEETSQVVTGDGVVATDDSIILVGRSQLTGYARAYDTNGENLWDQRREPQDGGLSTIAGVAEFPNDQLIAAGGEALGGSFVGFAVRLEASDGTETAQFQSDSIPSAFLGVAVDLAASEFVVGGFANGGAAEDDNIFVQRVSAAGAVQWADEFNGPGNGRDQANGIATSPDGSVVAVGEVFNATRDMWIRKYGPDGSVQWTESIDSAGGGADEARGVTVDSQGAIVVVGRLDRADLGQGSNAWVRKYDPDGDELWTRTHNGDANSYDSANGVAVDSEDRIVVVGKEGTNAAQDGRFWIRMYTP